MSGAKWFVVYTRPRWEKKVHSLLTAKSIESYCPLHKVRRKWSDRIKLVEEPLFKSYVFVRVEDKDKFELKHQEISIIKMDLKRDEKVVITAGPFMDKEGKVLEVKNKVARVIIESLGYMLVADIDKGNLVSVSNQTTD